MAATLVVSYVAILLPIIATEMPTSAPNETSGLCLWNVTSSNTFLNGEWTYDGLYNGHSSYHRHMCYDLYIWYKLSRISGWYISAGTVKEDLSGSYLCCASNASEPKSACDGLWGYDCWDYLDRNYATTARDSPCPSWDCDGISTGLSGNCGGDFDIKVGDNAWSNANGTYFIFFSTWYFSWMCANTLPDGCSSPFETRAKGWFHLEKGQSQIRTWTPNRYPHETKKARITCKPATPIPTYEPTLDPTTNQPSTSLPTTANPTPYVYKKLEFVCKYTDNKDYIATHLSFPEYAQIMADVIMNAIPSFTSQATETDSNQYPWKAQEIIDFIICSVFDTALRYMEESCPSHSIERNGRDEYYAIGTFEIIDDESMSFFINIMKSESFKNLCTEHMNNRLYNETYYTRRLSSSANFEIVSIDVIDPLNVTITTTEEEGDDELLTGGKSEDSKYFTFIMIFIGIVVCILLVGIVWYCYCYRGKANREPGQGPLANELEMLQANINQHGGNNIPLGMDDEGQQVDNIQNESDSDDQLIADNRQQAGNESRTPYVSR